MKTGVLDAHRLETTSISRELLSLKDKQDCYRRSFVRQGEIIKLFKAMHSLAHWNLGIVPNSKLALPIHPVSPMEITFNKWNHQKA